LTSTKCEQCGFLGAWHEFDFASREWWVDCPRCGYSKSWRKKSYFSNGHLEHGVLEVFYSAGSLWLVDAKSGTAQFRGLAEDEVEKIAGKMRAAIAAGELSAKSHVTKYNFEIREVTALVGQVPTCEETPAEENCSDVAPWSGH
jgi:hypothetical protein